MGPGMGLHSSRPSFALHKNLPLNGLLYTELHVILLYSQKHEGHRAATECISSHFNETGTSLFMLLHVWKTDIKQYAFIS
jgi:hypothetical protein